MTKLRLPVTMVLAAMTVSALGWVGLGAPAGSHSNAPTVADYCLITGAIYYQNRQLYGGGTYCVPAPGA
jgi:hypothetical protein